MTCNELTMAEPEPPMSPKRVVVTNPNSPWTPNGPATLSSPTEEGGDLEDIQKELKKMKTKLDEANAKIVELKEDHANKLNELSKTFISALGTHITVVPSDSDSEESQPSLGVGDLVIVNDTLGLENCVRTGHRLQCGDKLYVERITPTLLVNVSHTKGGDHLLKRAKDPSLFELFEKAEAQDPTHWLDLKQPFPMASEHNLLDEDCTFTAESLREVPVQSGAQGRDVTWNGITYRDRDFENKILKKWKEVFQEGSPFESSSYKSKTLEKLTEWAFQKCAKIENDVIKFETTKVKFRKDRHGNVIGAKGTGNYSITKFDVDHIFPWSRGGLTVPENLEAMHWRANRVVKKAKFLQELSKEKLETGLREEQIVCLFKYIKEEKAFEGIRVTRHMKAEAKKWNNRKAQKYRDKAISWLTSTAGTGEDLGMHENISEIGRNEDGSYSGSVIFNFLEYWFEGGGAERASQPVIDIPPPLAISKTASFNVFQIQPIEEGGVA
ncbi:hypothetical protein TL16_g11882 [Triparma laevis f. inornata]|uniref:HNH nuclease domain-containing protein n=1 Tax=Triparma laevis f. inornata TaxID=1714386 RepID=A0A9W7BHJ6_9STRA|nr:hypothetical protein TL16_g11882 [Triparma laevis f. inornata]